MFTMRKQQGVGLVETLLTFVLIAGSVIALLRFQNRLAYHDGIIQQQSEATLLATKQIETLRDFQVLTTQSPYSSYQQIASGSSVVAGSNASYNVAWTVTAYTNPNYKNINVVVSWTDRYGAAQSVNLVSNVAGQDPTTSGVVIQ